MNYYINNQFDNEKKLVLLKIISNFDVKKNSKEEIIFLKENFLFVSNQYGNKNI